MSTAEVVITYIGTILVGMEFIRKFTHLQALMGMLVGWPVFPLFSEKGLRGFVEIYSVHKFKITLRLVLSLVLCLAALPLTATFYVIWFAVLVLNSFHNWVNALYIEGRRRYRPMYMNMIGLTLFAHRLSDNDKFAAIDEQKVMQEIEKGEIPIIPIIGVILISVAFVLVLV